MEKKLKVLSVERTGGDSPYLMGIFEDEGMAERYASLFLFEEQPYQIEDVANCPQPRPLANGSYAYKALVQGNGNIHIQEILQPEEWDGVVISHLANGVMEIILAARDAEDLKKQCLELLIP